MALRQAESASYYEAFDPLKHGADAQRAEAKIKERERKPGHRAARREHRQNMCDLRSQ